ncbi:MAG: S-methyl-5'-thioadenosine phosphorylase [Nitrospirae bacterium]|nr:S-methyl-5'-thioadenosine phosphorylase [Nitrospirota bacterium]
MLIGIIAGSGLYQIEGLRITETAALSTPYGQPSSAYRLGTIKSEKGETRLAFLARHGDSHAIPPHQINYRANIWGFKHLGAERIISIGAVGAISKDIAPGAIVILDQLIDMTSGTEIQTYYDKDKVVHIDLTNPYCPEMRDSLIKASEKTKIPARTTGTYILVSGPRLETAAEIRFFSMIGGDVVGMTIMPEAVLARELEICISAIAVASNYAAGISQAKLTMTEVVQTMKDASESVKTLIAEAVSNLPSNRSCPCKDALKDAGA